MTLAYKLNQKEIINAFTEAKMEHPIIGRYLDYKEKHFLYLNEIFRESNTEIEYIDITNVQEHRVNSYVYYTVEIRMKFYNSLGYSPTEKIRLSHFLGVVTKDLDIHDKFINHYFKEVAQTGGL